MPDSGSGEKLPSGTPWSIGEEGRDVQSGTCSMTGVRVLLGGEGNLRRPRPGAARWRVRGRDLSGNRVERVQWRNRVWSVLVVAGIQWP